MTPRRFALAAALAATLAATAWVATRPDDVAEPVAAAPRRPVIATPVSTASAAPAASGTRADWAEASPGQLAAWQPPPPPPPPPAPPPPPHAAALAPPPPMAPPLPYQMIGRVIEGEGAKAADVALLVGPSHALSVKRGDVIDGQWRVEQVTPAGVSVTWLPGKLPQNIAFRPAP